MLIRWSPFFYFFVCLFVCLHFLCFTYCRAIMAYVPYVPLYYNDKHQDIVFIHSLTQSVSQSIIHLFYNLCVHKRVHLWIFNELPSYTSLSRSAAASIYTFWSETIFLEAGYSSCLYIHKEGVSLYTAHTRTCYQDNNKKKVFKPKKSFTTL